MRTFEINNKTYTALPFDFNLICDLEDLGVSINELSKKPMVAMRSYFALCLGGDKVRAGKELEEHIKNGGDFTPLFDVINKEMEMSDFFRSLAQDTTTEVAENENKKSKKTTKA